MKAMTITIDSLPPRPKLNCDVHYDAAVKGASVVVLVLQAMNVICKTLHQRSVIGRAIRKTHRRGLLKQETLHAREGLRWGMQRLWVALAGVTA
jgi:hypothetical protein